MLINYLKCTTRGRHIEQDA